MVKSDDTREKVKKEGSMVDYLNLIPTDSFIRHQLLRLFIYSGLEDFQAQILLSLVLHGGQIKPITLAKDIRCNPTRLELPDGFSSLIELNLIEMSHTRPKTVILAIGIDELLNRVSLGTLKPNYLIKPNEAKELMLKLDQLCLEIIDQPERKKIDEFVNLLHYFAKLQKLSMKIPSLFSLVFFILSSLWMNQNQAIILAKLIACGGKISKRQFYLEEIKNIEQNLIENSRLLEADFRSLDYRGEVLQNLIERSTAFFSQKKFDFRFSSEHHFNITLNCLEGICQSTSMGSEEGKRKFKYLTLVKTLSQLAESQYQSVIDLKSIKEPELQILKNAYSNVRLVDKDIFLSSIADTSSTRKRLETDVKYAQIIGAVIIHSNFVEDFLLKIFYSENFDVKLNLIVAEEQKELFIELLRTDKYESQEKRGILPTDVITFIPSDYISQDILIGNTIILFYKVGSSMIIIPEEITKRNPTEINMISDDVELAFNYFEELKGQFEGSTVTIKSLYNSGGT